MKNNFGNCPGVSRPTYNGPKLSVTFRYTDWEGGRRTRTIERPLSNPRKSEDAVLQEICAEMKRDHPTAKLHEFHKKEARNAQR